MLRCHALHVFEIVKTLKNALKSTCFTTDNRVNPRQLLVQSSDHIEASAALFECAKHSGCLFEKGYRIVHERY